MYATINFKNKKSLKEAIAKGMTVGIFQFNDMFSNPKANPDYSGIATIEGPYYPAPHSWYSTVTLDKGKIIKAV
jgi:hypothetical protein